MTTSILPKAIAAYLNATLDEMDGDHRLLMKALRNVAEAQGGVVPIEIAWSPNCLPAGFVFVR